MVYTVSIPHTQHLNPLHARGFPVHASTTCLRFRSTRRVQSAPLSNPLCPKLSQPLSGRVCFTLGSGFLGPLRNLRGCPTVRTVDCLTLPCDISPALRALFACATLYVTVAPGLTTLDPDLQLCLPGVWFMHSDAASGAFLRRWAVWILLLAIIVGLCFLFALVL
ncbi:hypothetical protein E4T42_02772 [Aureobasidium subglaciale]|nr:hypothetical protein E4T42_02772 [Aureobasidium subglaciale]